MYSEIAILQDSKQSGLGIVGGTCLHFEWAMEGEAKNRTDAAILKQRELKYMIKRMEKLNECVCDEEFEGT